MAWSGKGHGAWGMQATTSDNTNVGGWSEDLLVVGLTAVPAAVVLAAVPATNGSTAAAVVASAVAGLLLAIAALLFYFHWLTTPGRRQGWTTTMVVVIASQVLLTASHHLAEPASAVHEIGSRSRALDAVTLGILLALMALGRRAVANPAPLLLGVGLAGTLATLHLAAHVAPPLSVPTPAAAAVLPVILVGHLLVAWWVLDDQSLTLRVRRHLALTVALVGFADFSGVGAFHGLATDLAAATALVGAAALWVGAAFVLLRDSLATQHSRSVALEGSLLEFETDLRGNREQMHEIRSTVAGAASASKLLSERPLGAATHHHLVESIATELGRLERLVSHRPPADPGPVDIDHTLDILLESHRAQGRTVEWEPSGAAVHARQDDVTEALNILLDNAATHGGTASRVAVTQQLDVVEIAVTDHGPGVRTEDRDDIFDWGVHGDASPGEGIGLNVARRLVAEHGGTLTLSEPTTAPGSSFVIRLPAARRSEEEHVRNGGH